MLNPKILSYGFLVCIVCLIFAIIYVAIALPYGSLEKVKVYNLGIINALLVPMAALLGALFGILSTEKKGKDKEKE